MISCSKKWTHEETIISKGVHVATEKRYRIQFDFLEDGFNQLNALQERLGAPSRAEVVRSALAVLRWVCDKVADDYRIVAIGKDDECIVEPIFSFPLKKE